MSLNDLVNVVITKGTRSIPMPSFSKAAILSDECNFQERVRFYSTADEIINDVLGGNKSLAYKVASALKSNTPSPNSFALINRIGNRYILNNGGYATAGFTISLKVNGVLASATGTVRATVMGDLVTALKLIPGVDATTSYSDTTFVLTIVPTGSVPLYLSAFTVTTTDTLSARIAAPTIIKDNAGTFTSGSITSYVNGTEVKTSWITSKAATMAAHAVALAALTGIDAAFYVAGSNSIFVFPDVDKAAFMEIDTSGSIGTIDAGIVLSGNETVGNALTAANNEDSSWYALVQALGTTKDQVAVVQDKDIAAWVESHTKVFIARSTDADVVDVASSSDTTSIAARLKALGYVRTAVIYGAMADSQFPDAAILSVILPKAPGSYTLKFKALVGVTIDALTTTQVTNAHNKNASVYINESIDMVDDGKTASGEWLDIVIGLDWITSQIQTNVMYVFANNDKLPFDDRGITVIGSAISQAMEAGISSTLLTQPELNDKKQVIGGYYLDLPKAADVSSADKAARTLNGVKATAFLAGAIHATTINVTVLY
jgi:hypothetical protein